MNWSLPRNARTVVTWISALINVATLRALLELALLELDMKVSNPASSAVNQIVSSDSSRLDWMDLV
jgi:hypothetical protein